MLICRFGILSLIPASQVWCSVRRGWTRVINTKATFTALLLTFLSACSEQTIEFENLVERGDVYYEKFSTEPFSGRVTGRTTGQLVDGRFEGLVHIFGEDGNLLYETSYKGGLKDGLQTRFLTEGRSENEYVEGRQVAWRVFTGDILTLNRNFKDDKRHGVQENFHPNGNLQYRVHYENGKRMEDVLDVFSIDGKTHLEVPIYRSDVEENLFHYADGLVRIVGNDTCGVEYDKGRNPVLKIALEFEDEDPEATERNRQRIRCTKLIEKIIDDVGLKSIR